jgi:hypothetical protein
MADSGIGNTDVTASNRPFSKGGSKRGSSGVPLGTPYFRGYLAVWPKRV